MANMKPRRAGASKFDSTNAWNQEKLLKEMATAKRLGRDDLYVDAFRQLCRAAGRDNDDPLDAEFASVLMALEEVFADKAGESRRLSRTKQTLSRYGVVHTLGDLALKSKASDGFLKLLELGVADMTAEKLVLKHRDRFEDDVILAAEHRLREFGVLKSGT
jgi:hypothetical protein